MLSQEVNSLVGSQNMEGYGPPVVGTQNYLELSETVSKKRWPQACLKDRKELAG